METRNLIGQCCAAATIFKQLHLTVVFSSCFHRGKFKTIALELFYESKLLRRDPSEDFNNINDHNVIISLDHRIDDAQMMMRCGVATVIR